MAAPELCVAFTYRRSYAQGEAIITTVFQIIQLEVISFGRPSLELLRPHWRKSALMASAPCYELWRAAGESLEEGPSTIMGLLKT